MVKVQKTKIDGVLIITPPRFSDDRGFFSETYNKQTLMGAGIEAHFVQDNHSMSVEQGTIRGLHFQAPPHAQTKLVRVAAGAIRDIAVDARKGSRSFGEYVSTRLGADDGAQLFVPEGFLHGFVTLEPNTHVIYKVDNFYNREADGSVRWDDPDLAINWGVDPAKVVLSEKDKSAVRWSEFNSPF